MKTYQQLKDEGYFDNKPEATYGSSVVVGRERPTAVDEKEYPMTSAPIPGGVVFPPMEKRTAPMNASEEVVERIRQANIKDGFYGTTPAIDNTVRVPDQIVNGVPQSDYPNYPNDTTIVITRGNGVEKGPNGQYEGIPTGPYQGDPLGAPPEYEGIPTGPYVGVPQAAAPIVRDRFGNPVRSGDGGVINLPTQNPNYQAPNAGGKGSDATVGSAVKQLGGK